MTPSESKSKTRFSSNLFLSAFLVCGALSISAFQTNEPSPANLNEMVAAHIQSTKTKIDTANMVFVKGGSYFRGSMSFANEQPVHEVDLDDFYIDKYEVTVAEFRKFCEATGREMPKEPEWKFEGKENYPIVNVSWDEAVAYAQWVGKRLPTEAEWEFAAKGGILSKGNIYSGGNYPDAVAWFERNSPSGPQPVGLKKPNELGIYDMSGNVWEWCFDVYGTYPNNSKERLKNPKGPSNGLNRVTRGGSWFGNHNNLRIANRYYHPPGFGTNLIGFRLVRDAK